MFFKKPLVIDARELLTSELHDEHSFYDRLLADIASARTSIYIESPFISVKRTDPLLPYLDAAVMSGVKITIVTRHPDAHDEVAAAESYSAVRAFRSLGMKVEFSSPRLHRKLVIIDDRILYEGSLNILSHVSSEEIMRRLESTVLVIQMKDYLRI